MKAKIIREHQKNSFWNSSLREYPIYVEYDGSTYNIENGHTIQIELNPNIKYLRFVVPDGKKTMTDDIVDLVRTVIFKNVEDITFKVKFKGVLKLKLSLEANRKVKIKKS